MRVSSARTVSSTAKPCYGTFPNDCSQCDTYGPLTYLSYVPFEKLMPWTGTWNDLPAAHVAATVFDILALLGLLILGWRIAGPRLGVSLSLAWATYPFSAYALESNSNDSLVAAILAWGLVVAHRPIGRGMAIAFAAWAKFAPGILLLLWLRHPFPRAGSRKRWPGYLAGLVLATVLSAWPLLLDGGDGVRRFWSRTMAYQLDRESPFSIWGQHLGLQPVQRAVEVVVVLIAIVVVARPRALDLRRFAALSAALLIGLQIAMPHWFYLYIPWFLPCALVAMVPTWRVVHDVREPAPAGDQVATGEPDAGPGAAARTGMNRRRQALVALTAIAAWIAAVNLPVTNPLTSDVALYEVVGRDMAAGQMPYRDFFLEYPPGAAFFFWLARMVPVSYATGVSVLLCAALVVTSVAVMRPQHTGWASAGGANWRPDLLWPSHRCCLAGSSSPSASI